MRSLALALLFFCAKWQFRLNEIDLCYKFRLNETINGVVGCLLRVFPEKKSFFAILFSKKAARKYVSISLFWMVVFSFIILYTITVKQNGGF